MSRAGAEITATRRPRSAPPPPAPRRFAQARAQASYEKLLGAALELYAERGYHATQTPDVAERAGMSVGGLYRYFEDKHQIFVELMHRLAVRLQVQLEFVPYAYDTMIEQLESGEIDLVSGGLIMNPERLLRVGFTQPYQTATIAVVLLVLSAVIIGMQLRFLRSDVSY